MKAVLACALFLSMCVGAVSCAPPATHEYPSSTVRSVDLVGRWQADLRSKSFWTDAGVEVLLTGRASLELDADGMYTFSFVKGSGADSSETRGRWRLCKRLDVGDARELQCVCLDSLSLMPSVAKSSRIDVLAIEGDARVGPDGPRVSLCALDEDLMLCFTREGRVIRAR